MTTLNEINIPHLHNAVEAVREGGVYYALPAAVFDLVQGGYVESNPQFVDPATGGVAHRATDVGIIAYQNYVAAQSTIAVEYAPPAAANPAPTPTGSTAPQLRDIQKGSGGFVAPVKRMRYTPSKRGYPFHDLANVGDYFFVPATPSKPNPVSSSTISGANKRFADFVPRRVFKAYTAVAGQVFGSVVAPADGVYIVRVEPPAQVSDVEASVENRVTYNAQPVAE